MPITLKMYNKNAKNAIKDIIRDLYATEAGIKYKIKIDLRRSIEFLMTELDKFYNWHISNTSNF